MATITIDLTPDGAPPKVEVDGMRGSGCELLGKVFEDALGGECVEDIKKPEYLDEQEHQQGADQW